MCAFDVFLENMRFLFIYFPLNNLPDVWFKLMRFFRPSSRFSSTLINLRRRGVRNQRIPCRLGVRVSHLWLVVFCSDPADRRFATNAYHAFRPRSLTARSFSHLSGWKGGGIVTSTIETSCLYNMLVLAHRKTVTTLTTVTTVSTTIIYNSSSSSCSYQRSMKGAWKEHPCAPLGVTRAAL